MSIPGHLPSSGTVVHRVRGPAGPDGPYQTLTKAGRKSDKNSPPAQPEELVTN